MHLEGLLRDETLQRPSQKGSGIAELCPQVQWKSLESGNTTATLSKGHRITPTCAAKIMVLPRFDSARSDLSRACRVTNSAGLWSVDSLSTTKYNCWHLVIGQFPRTEWNNVVRFQVLLEVATVTLRVIFPRQLGPFQICHIWSLLFVIVIVYARWVVSKAKKLGKVECQTKRTTLPGSKAASGVVYPSCRSMLSNARDRVIFSRRRAFSHKAQTINLKLSYWPRSPQRQISCRITVFFI